MTIDTIPYGTYSIYDMMVRNILHNYVSGECARINYTEQ